MPQYSYKARDASGREVKGALEARSQEDAAMMVGNMGLLATQIVSAGSSGGGFGGLTFFRRIKNSELNMFYIQLSNMISAGINILHSLETLIKQVDNDVLRSSLERVAEYVREGDSFSGSLLKYPGIFPNLFVSMIKAGETSGKLDEVLKRYADFCERQENLKQKIIGAVFYPVLLLGAGLMISVFLVVFVIPNIMEMFVGMQGAIPLPTLILYKLGTAIKSFWYLFIIGGAGLGFALKQYSATSSGSLMMDAVKLKIPIVGKLYRNIIITRFSGTLGTLLESGVPILESLDITRDIVANRVIAGKIGEILEDVRGGGGVAATMRRSEVFPVDVVEMIAVGEESGNLDVMLTKIAHIYDMYVDYSTKKLSTTIEPLLILFLGCIVGFIMASMLIPIFRIVTMIKV